jgi:hypothetical protein
MNYISNHALAAKNIKYELNKAFPGVIFSVRSKSFSGGDDVNVSWELGPTTKEVDAIIDRYQEGDFDGMIDLYEYRRDSETSKFQKENGSAKYVFSQRSFPDYAYDIVIKHLCEIYNVPFEAPLHSIRIDDEYATTLFHRLMQKTSLPAGAVITGMKRTGCTCGSLHEFYEITFDMPVKETKEPLKTENVTVRRNEEKNGIEVLFPVKPDQSIIERLKEMGFRWSQFQKLWWRRYDEGIMNILQGMN